MQVYKKLCRRVKKINQTFNILAVLSHNLINYPVTHTLNFTGHCEIAAFQSPYGACQ